MAAAPALFVAGAGLSIYGQFRANQEEAKAERANAAFYEQQARYALEARQREKTLFDMESRQFFGTQVNAFAKSGVDMSGSVLMKLAHTKMLMGTESANIEEMGRREFEMGMQKAAQARAKAKTLNSLEYNLLQAAPVAFNAAGNVMNSNKLSTGGDNGSTGTGTYSSSYYSPSAGKWETMTPGRMRIGG